MCREGYRIAVTVWLSRRTIENSLLLGLINAYHEASGKIYGARRVWLDLSEVGEKVSLNRVARIILTHKIRAQRGYKQPDYKYHKPSVATPNRLPQQFTIGHPDSAWVTDITYIRTYEGWLYLAVVMDLYSRKVIGWSMKPTLAKELVLDAILMAAWR